VPSPAAYLRKSKDATTKAEHLDRLLATVRRHGHNGDTVIYDDWARSGDQRKLASRKAWRELCGAIERGEHDVVFMNDLDRGGRSLEEWLRFIRIAQEHRVRVIAGETDYSAPENKDRLIFEAWLAERELDAAKRRAAATIRMRQGRGDVLGQPPYGYRLAKQDGRVVLLEDPDHPLHPILDAMRDAQGNTAEVVRLLNDRAIPSRYGKSWSPPALRRVLRRLGAAPRARARRTRSGRLSMPSALSKLVRCHCGTTMTATDSRNELYCYMGTRLGLARHGRYVMRQTPVLEFAKAEAAHLDIPYDKVTLGVETSQRREALEQQRERLGWAVTDGLLSRDAAKARAEEIDHELKNLEEAEQLVDIPAVDWTAEPASLNSVLHALWEAIDLDAEMRPVRALWRVPEWRRP